MPMSDQAHTHIRDSARNDVSPGPTVSQRLAPRHNDVVARVKIAERELAGIIRRGGLERFVVFTLEVSLKKLDLDLRGGPAIGSEDGPVDRAAKASGGHICHRAV